MDVNKRYTHFAVNKKNNKILTGWEYRNLDKEAIIEYSVSDIEDFDENPKEYKILTAKRCKEVGIDPFDFNYWV